MVADSEEADSTAVVCEEAVMAEGLLAMAMLTDAGLLDVGTTADTTALTADGAAYTEEEAAASTARSGVPTRHIMVVFGERQGSQVTPVFTTKIRR